MNSQTVRIIVWGAVAVAVAVVSYIRYTAGKVSALAEEANVQVDEGENKLRELGPEANQLLCGPVPKALTSDPAKFQELVVKTEDILAKVAEHYRAAAEKFGAAGKAGKSTVVAKYFELMSQACRNRADAKEAHRQAVAALVDKSIQSADELQERRNTLFKGASASEGEFERLQEEAQKLHDENQSKFK